MSEEYEYYAQFEENKNTPARAKQMLDEQYQKKLVAQKAEFEREKDSPIGISISGRDPHRTTGKKYIVQPDGSVNFDE
ncbi:hypothetical protein [Rahnella selenatireducens]|uniref:hypothetical protein n=1 Tax=Rahnella selenatireducens TaxID=3389797 RepID=UPI0039693E42